MHRNDPNDTTLAAAYEKGDGEACCRCRSLPGTGRSCERRDTPRGWCRSGSSLVAARQFNIVPAACLSVICEVVQADTRPKPNRKPHTVKGHQVTHYWLCRKCVTCMTLGVKRWSRRDQASPE